ncbi:MAG: hypothetical protein JSR21_02210 [Proteobacteria bacterium]|nr:hypothetical protein [Pseudomonadota bacterium]
MDVSDPTLKERLDAAKSSRRAAADRVHLLEEASASGAGMVTEQTIDRLAAALRDALTSDDPTFRKAYVHLFFERITVGLGEVRMQGPTAALAGAATDGTLPPAGGLVPFFVREWRAGRDKTENWSVAVSL